MPAARAVLPAGVVYGVGRIDGSGRVSDRAVTVALGWRNGDRLTITGTESVVIARRDPAGMVTVAARTYIQDLAGTRIVIDGAPGPGPGSSAASCRRSVNARGRR